MEPREDEKNPIFADLLRLRRGVQTPQDGDEAELDAALSEGLRESWVLAGHHESMLDALPVGILTVGVMRDRYRHPTGYQILHANPSCLTLLRMDMEALGKRSLYDILPGGEEWKPALDGVALRGHPVREVGYSTITNGYFDVAVSRPLRDVLNVVLAEVKAPARRQASDTGDEILFQDILEAAPIYICRFLSDGTLTYANPAYRSRFGDGSETLVGHCFLIHVPLAQRNRVQRELKRLRPDERVLTCEHDAYGAGSTRTYAWYDVGVFDKEGQLVEFQAFGFDCTERKRTEKSLFQLRGYLEDLLDHRNSEVTGLERRVDVEHTERERVAQALSEARRDLDFAASRALGGDLIVCGRCHRVNDDEGHWMPIDMYLLSHTAAKLKTDICPYCKRKPRGSDVHEW